MRTHRIRTVPPSVTVREAERQATLVRADRAFRAELKVPVWEMRPAPETRIRVRISLPLRRGVRAVKLFDGIGVGVRPGSGVGVSPGSGVVPGPLGPPDADPYEAVTARACVTLTVHVVAVPLHAPPQPLKSLPGGSVASRVTVDPDANPYSQDAPQLMPPGFEMTRPGSVPVISTSTGWLSFGSIGHGASTVPSVPTAAVFVRV